MRTKARHVECTLDEYHTRPEWSRSQLWDLHKRGPKFFHGTHVSRIYAKKHIKACDTGTIAHAALLDEGGLAGIARIIPAHALNSQGHRRGKGWVAWNKAIPPDKLRITEKENAAVKMMIQSVLEHPEAAQAIHAIEHYEYTIIWRDDATGLEYRARPDGILACGERKKGFELKTTSKETPAAFLRHAAELGYHFQLAWNWEAIELMGGDVADFVTIAVQSEPPYETWVFPLDQMFEDSVDTLDEGRAIVAETRKELAMRLEADNWQHERERSLLPYRLPAWAIRPVEISAGGKTLTV